MSLPSAKPPRTKLGCGAIHRLLRHGIGARTPARPSNVYGSNRPIAEVNLQSAEGSQAGGVLHNQGLTHAC